MECSKMKNNIVLLLTACVNPNGMSYTQLQSPEIRKKQYIDALNFYLGKTSYPIVFVENSGCDFSSDFTEYINSSRLEYLTFQGNNYDKSPGKGLGETNILRYALDNSLFIKKCKYFIKITGRLKVNNISHFTTSKWMYLHNIFRCDLLKSGYAQSMVFISSPKVLFKLLNNGFGNINDSLGIYFEHCLYESLRKCKQAIIIPFAEAPAIEGYTGSNNDKYITLPKSENLFRNLRICTHLYSESHRYIMTLICLSIYWPYKLRFNYYKRKENAKIINHNH